MLTLKEWDEICDELEPEVMPNTGEKEEKFLWAVYGGLLQLMKENNLTIDDVLVTCEEHVADKKKGLSENNERKSIQ